MQKTMSKGIYHSGATRGQNIKFGTDEPSLGKVNSTFPAVLHFLNKLFLTFRNYSNSKLLPVISLAFLLNIFHST
jgi:hypothetical protein